MPLISARVTPLVLAVEVEAPVLLEVSVADHRADGENCPGAVQAPSRASQIEAVGYEMTACALDFLVRVTSRQQPDPGTELGLHIHHLLTSRQQLLGQQMPQATSALDRPGPLRPGRRPV